MHTNWDLVKDWDKFLLEEKSKSQEFSMFESKEALEWNGYVSEDSTEFENLASIALSSKDESTPDIVGHQRGSAAEDSTQYTNLASIALPSKDESIPYIGNQRSSSVEESLDYYEKLSSIAKSLKDEPTSFDGLRRSRSESKGSLGNSFGFYDKRPSTAQTRSTSSFSGNHHENELNRPSTANVKFSSMSGSYENDGKLSLFDSSESESRLILGESLDYENKPNIYDDNEWDKFLGISHAGNESHKRRPLIAKQHDKSNRRIDELYKLGKKKVTMQRLRASTAPTPKTSTTPHTSTSRTLTPSRRRFNNSFFESSYDEYLPNEYRQRRACERLYEYSTKKQEEGRQRRKAIEEKIRSSIHC